MPEAEQSYLYENSPAITCTACDEAPRAAME
jgi:hypothetical protein